MTSSNKARRYLQHHKQHFAESNNNQHSVTQLLVTDSTSSTITMRKFKGKTQQQQSSIPISIPQICVNNNDDDDDDDNNDNDDNRHVSILNEFDQVLENELKRTSISRTLSLKKNESLGHMEIPINQQRSFSFALGSKTNLHEEKHDNNESMNILSSKIRKLSATSKSSLSKETFSRLFQSLTFRSGNHSMSKISLTKPDFKYQQHSCLACQNYPNLDVISKNKKRPSIFGVLVSKLNTSSSLSTATITTTSSENTSKCCSVCKRPLLKSISNNDDNQQLSLSKNLHDQKQLFSRTKRRRSLPSLLHNLIEPSLSSSSAQHRPSFSTVSNHILLDNVNREHQQQSSTLSQSSTSLTESDDSSDHNNTNNNSFQQRQHINYDDSSQLTEKYGNKDENDNEIVFDCGESHNSNIIYSNDVTNEHNTNQQFLHPPEEKTRSLLVNVFRTRRSNVILDSNDTNMIGKQLSTSVINLATSMGINRRNSAISTIYEKTTFDQRKKYAISEENLLSIDNTYIYFNNINGQSFKEQLKYSTISENTTLREMLIKLFNKYNLSIETYNICLRSAPTLPLSLDQPVKHLLLDDLVVTGIKKKIDYAISSFLPN